ncbi:MAG: hypothetical protein V4726_21290 [Verrucomicrobiota bacterium]
MKLSYSVSAVLFAGAALLSSCTTVVEKPTPTTQVSTRHTETSTAYPVTPLSPAVSTTTETRSVRAE